MKSLVCCLQGGISRSKKCTTSSNITRMSGWGLRISHVFTHRSSVWGGSACCPACWWPQCPGPAAGRSCSRPVCTLHLMPKYGNTLSLLCWLTSIKYETPDNMNMFMSEGQWLNESSEERGVFARCIENMDEMNNVDNSTPFWWKNHFYL